MLYAKKEATYEFSGWRWIFNDKIFSAQNIKSLFHKHEPYLRSSENHMLQVYFFLQLELLDEVYDFRKFPEVSGRHRKVYDKYSNQCYIWG